MHLLCQAISYNNRSVGRPVFKPMIKQHTYEFSSLALQHLANQYFGQHARKLLNKTT